MEDIVAEGRVEDLVDRGQNVGRDQSFNCILAVAERQVPLSFHDPVVEGRKILRLAGLEPPDEYFLIAVQRPGTRSIGLDEEIDLREPAREEFRAFESDRGFNFTVNERGYEWGAAIISEADLRYVTGISDDEDLILDREDKADQVIRKGGQVDLAERGTEHIRSRKRPDSFEVVVLYNGLKKPLTVTNGEFIRDVLARAIALFGSLPNPHTLVLFTADKGELKDEWTVREAGVTPHEEVLLRSSTVKAG